VRDVVRPAADSLGLTDEDRNETSPSWRLAHDSYALGMSHMFYAELTAALSPSRMFRSRFIRVVEGRLDRVLR
jgi:hypothetical protein